MTVYKTSFVIAESDHPGAIINMDHKPRVGETMKVEEHLVMVTEVIELIPPRGEFCYFHATCSIVEESNGVDESPS